MKELLDDYDKDIMFQRVTDILLLSIGTLVINQLLTSYDKQNAFITIMTNVSYGYIASYIFYILNIYLPNKKKIRSEYELLAIAACKIEYNISQFRQAYNLLDHSIAEEFILSDVTAENTFTLLTIYTESITTLLGQAPKCSPHLSQEQIDKCNQITNELIARNPNSKLPPPLNNPQKSLEIICHAALAMLENALLEAKPIDDEFYHSSRKLIATIKKTLAGQDVRAIAVSGKKLNLSTLIFEDIESWLEKLQLSSETPVHFKNARKILMPALIKRASKKQQRRIDNVYANLFQQKSPTA